MEILIIGAGIVGMSTAWRLSRDGHAVTVLDREPAVGQGASRANGAQLSYSYVAPLADPSVWAQLPTLLLDPNSAVRFRPGLEPFQYRWLLRFLAACNRTTARRTIEALTRLASASQTLLATDAELSGLSFARRRTGKLVVYSDIAAFAKARDLAAFQASLGTERRALGCDECLALEPTLASIGQRLVGGLYSPGDETGDALRLTAELARLLETGPNPGRVVLDAEVRHIVVGGGRIRRVDTSRGSFGADLVVLAAGTGSRALGRQVGLDLPIYPVKGYSATAPAGTKEAFAVSVTDAARKVVYARLGDEVRLAGIADLVGADLAIDRRRVDTLLDQARQDFPQAADWRAPHLWAGLRPTTPSGVPLIGPTRIANLLLNTGHGSLGFTLALGSAQRLAETVAALPNH